MGELSPDYDLHRQQMHQARASEREQTAKEISMLLKADGHDDLAARVLAYVRAKG